MNQSLCPTYTQCIWNGLHKINMLPSHETKIPYLHLETECFRVFILVFCEFFILVYRHCIHSSFVPSECVNS